MYFRHELAAYHRTGQSDSDTLCRKGITVYRAEQSFLVKNGRNPARGSTLVFCSQGNPPAGGGALRYDMSGLQPVVLALYKSSL